jgi:hypothetical protein
MVPTLKDAGFPLTKILQRASVIVQRRIALNNTDAKRLPRFVILFPSKKREQEQSKVLEN